MDKCLLNYLVNGFNGKMPAYIELTMYRIGAFLILKDFPEGHEFGVDYKSWTVDQKFMGLKAIPPGIHYMYISSGEIIVRKWDATKDNFSEDTISNQEVERFRRNLLQADSRLPPYPFETYRTWYYIANFITEDTLKRLHPLKGKISAQAKLVCVETQLMETKTLHANIRCKNTIGRDIMKARPGYEIRFVEIPQLGASHRVGIDYTDRLNGLLQQLNGDWNQLMAELQFAFTCFLFGQVFEGFEQWKRLIHLLCCCPSAFRKYDEQFQIFIKVLHFQIKESPTDFLLDLVSKDNFLPTTLSMLFENIMDSNHVSSAQLKMRSQQFKKCLQDRFKWSLDLF